MSEAIQQDVSGTESPDGAVSDEAIVESAPLAMDPVSKRERKIKEAHEARKREVAEQRDIMAEIHGGVDPTIGSPPSQETGAAAGEDLGDPPVGEEVGQGAEEVPSGKSETPAAPTPDGWATNEQGQRYKTLVVNGQERQITEQEYDRMIQKDMAGDQKLQLAARMEKQLSDRAAELEKRERALTEQMAAPSQEATPELKEMISQHAELLLDGRTDEANEMMAKIVGRQQSPTLNFDAIAEQAATQAEQRLEKRDIERSVEKGFKRFQEDYDYIVKDPDAFAFADHKLKELRNKYSGTKTPEEIILMAGDETRKRLFPDRPAVTDAQASGDQSGDAVVQNEGTSERMARKENLRPLPKPGSTRHVPAKEPELDMSPKAKIQRMKQSRYLA